MLPVYWSAAGKQAEPRSPTSLMLCLLLNQGIAQLFIIIRVATGRAVTSEWSTSAAAVPTRTLEFSGAVSNTTEGSIDEQTARAGQGTVHTSSVAEKESCVV